MEANSQIRSDEQTITARFWKDFSYTQTPAGHWNEIASFVAEKQNFTLIEEAKLFALLNLSMADAGIVAWECKYKHHLWRPIHAIRHADQFELTSKLHNQMEPLIETPAHPEYISAHLFLVQLPRFFAFSLVVINLNFEQKVMSSQVTLEHLTFPPVPKKLVKVDYSAEFITVFQVKTE